MTTRDIVGSTSGFFSPGGSGEFPRTTPVLDRSMFATRSDLASGVDSVFRPNARGTLSVRIVVQGLQVVHDHAAAVDIMIPGAIGVIHSVTGRLTVEDARRSMLEDFPKPPILTGATRDSIHARLETTPGVVITSVGPTTFYSPFIEFGLAAHFTYGPRPFMSIAFARVLPQHLQALRDLARVAAVPRARITGRYHGPPTNSYLARFRAFLYTTEKRLGDTVAYGGMPGLRPAREATLGMARVLGDIQSVLRSAVGARFARRLEGKVTGRLIGIGSHTIFGQRNVIAHISGAERTYNVIAGGYMNKFMSQTNLFGGG